VDEAQRRYRASEKGRAKRREYRMSGQLREASSRYARTPKRRVAQTKYRRSPKGRANGRRQVERVATIKLERGCIDCGFRAHPAALQFDHRDPNDKVAGVSFLAMRSAPWAVIEAEIAKCDVRCANCHAIRTAERGVVARRTAPPVDAPQLELF
jgi:hypothetical protein